MKDLTNKTFSNIKLKKNDCRSYDFLYIIPRYLKLIPC